VVVLSAARQLDVDVILMLVFPLPRKFDSYSFCLKSFSRHGGFTRGRKEGQRKKTGVGERTR
jgi:hypothetical protein